MEAGGRAMNGSSGGARKGARSGHGAHRTQNGNASSNAAASKKFSSKFSSKLASSSLTPSSGYFESTWSNASGFAVGKGLGGRCKGKFGLGAHFIFRKVLGEGSEGQTWACEEVATRRLVAVKVIARHSDEPRLRKNSLRETLERNLYLKRRSGAEREGPRAEANDKKKKKKAKKFNPGRVAAEIIMQCALSHPNLVQLSSVYMSNTHLGLVMELVQGGELYGYVKEHPIPEEVLFPDRIQPQGGAKGSKLKSLSRAFASRGKGKAAVKGAGKTISSVYSLHKRPSDEKYRKHLDEERALYFFKQVLSGVSYCHRHHIAHRDLKLTNVLVDTAAKPPTLKICDFGLSKHWITPPEQNADDDDNKSVSESVVSDFEKQSDPYEAARLNAEEFVYARCRTRVGSPMYVAREIVSRDFCIDGYDGTAVDIWSMGIMLYYMLRGKFPFPDFNNKGSMEILKRIPSRVKTDLLRNDLSKSELSDDAIDLLHRMLRFDTSERIKLDEIYDHPWVQREQDHDKIEKLFSPLYQKRGGNAASMRQDSATAAFTGWIRGILEKLGGSRKCAEDRGPSSGHSTAIDDGHCKSSETNSSDMSSHANPEDLGPARAVLSQPSGKSFPTDCWLEVKEMVYRASRTVGGASERVEIWRPPFGPFRLTFSPGEADVMRRKEKAMTS